MAVTKIWNIKVWLGTLELYIQNPEKTENPQFYEHDDMGNKELQGMEDLIQIAMEDEKATEFKEALDYAMNDEKTNMRHYVSSVNCSLDTAREDMIAVKKRYGKEGGNAAYHAIQAFKPGEVTADMAHSIGIKLAEELWGDRFQVIIATHLDKGHLHNHFLLNSVSFTDGGKYNDCKESYRRMREVSDRLCREYGLSVVENSQQGNSKHYAKWQAEKDGKPTLRTMLKTDIDTAIIHARTEDEFFSILRKQGYEFKFGQDITIKAKGRERGLKLVCNFGSEYSLERIRHRIIEHRPPQMQKKSLYIFRYTMHGSFNKIKKLTGFKALYISYMFKMGILSKARRNNSRTAPPHILFREDLSKIHQYDEELGLLLVNQIDSDEQLFSFIDKRKICIGEQELERKKLTNSLRYIKSDSENIQIKQQISDISKNISTMRKEVKASERIQDKTPVMTEKLRIVQQDDLQYKLPHRFKKCSHLNQR